MEQVKQNFWQELQRAAAGEPSSLSFIKHELPEKSLVTEGERFQVIVIGGSVFRKAIIKKNRLELVVEYQEEHAQPAFLSKDAFLNFIKEQLALDISVIGLNFAYPLSPVFRDGRLDGVLISGTKENTFSGLTGEQVGKTIEEAVQSAYQRRVFVSVANDAICLLLSGMHSYPRESLVAAIMGTGTNITFFQERYAINLESANFDKFTPSDECKAIDVGSAKPGRAMFEKETAGGYLYQHFNLLVKKQQLAYPTISSSKELTDIAEDKKIPVLSQLATSLLLRSAEYFAAQFAAIAAFKQKPITVIIEGSFFWKNDIYQQHFHDCLKQLSPGFPITIIRLAVSPVIGGAKLVT